MSAALEDWRAGRKTERLWQRDATLWSRGDEARWLDWLTIVEVSRRTSGQAAAFSEEVRSAGFTHVLLMGMGGSSLCPEVLSRTFPRRPGFPDFRVLDSTDPAQILATESHLDLPRTLFIVASKSGSTLEPALFKDYFLERMRQAVGRTSAGSHFVAITDPGSRLQEEAAAEGFRQVFLGVPGIGGRYSALSSFGMVPAAILGIDLPRFLDSTAEMVEACSAATPPEQNPGVVLGCILGRLALAGRDKVTFLASPEIRDLGAWLEQLLAESTGKQGKGLIPVDREFPGPPGSYGQDRIFVSLGMSQEMDVARESEVAELERAGHPVVRIVLRDRYDLGQEFFRWEMATAVAGSILGIHPFDQPDVEASKIATRELTASYERSGSLPVEAPLFEDEAIRLHADADNAAALVGAAGSGADLTTLLRAHLNRLGSGDYFALLAYLEMSAENEALLQAMREIVRGRKRVATCLGFGPRFLHSTGQAYKGGPNRGVFLQITCSDERDVALPGRNLTFGTVKTAQALGDFQVLAQRKRRALRVHLMGRTVSGLEKLGRSMERAVAAGSHDR